jgi:hypothetical protein
MGSTYYDHKARRAYETFTKIDPKTGIVERFIKREVPYNGEPPFGAAHSQPKPNEPMSKAEAERLRADIHSFLMHSDDSPLDEQSRAELRKRAEWERNR